MEIDVRTLKNTDLTGSTVLVAIPSVGLASTIAATFMLTSLKMDQIAGFDCDEFPPLSMVYAHKPKFPVRVYFTPRGKVAVFISEVPLPAKTHRPLARKLLEWVKSRGARRILCLEGLPRPAEEAETESEVWAVGSTAEANRDIEGVKLPYLETGMIAGVAGVLLNEGRWAGYNVIALLGEARPYLPDAEAAARLVEAADRLLPDVEINLEPLREQAKALEAHLQTLKEQAKPVTPEVPPAFYR